MAPLELKRTITARSVYVAAAPCDRPVRASMPAPFGVASKAAVNEPDWTSNAAFWKEVVLVVHNPPDEAVTVIAAVPLCPSLVAVIVAEPAAIPVTRPLGLTVAAAVLSLDHVTVRPDRVLPFASLGVALSCTVFPAATRAEAGETATEATGTTVTVIVAVPVFVSLVAVIVAEPAAMPVTRPLPLTTAAAVLLLDHVTTRPDRVLPFASLGVALSCTVFPAATLAEAGETATEATATSVTVIVAVPLCPSLVAVIVADPGARAVTLPLTSATATEVLLLDQAIARPNSALPLASFGVALRWTD